MSDLSANELARRAGVTYRQLDYWCRIGLLPDTARGSGSARRFDASDFAVVCRLRALLDAGVSLQSARRVVSYLRDPEGCRYLYVDAVGGGVCSSEELARVAAESSGVVVVVDLERVA